MATDGKPSQDDDLDRIARSGAHPVVDVAKAGGFERTPSGSFRIPNLTKTVSGSYATAGSRSSSFADVLIRMLDGLIAAHREGGRNIGTLAKEVLAFWRSEGADDLEVSPAGLGVAGQVATLGVSPDDWILPA